MSEIFALLHTIFFWLIVLRAISSFLPGNENNPLMKFSFMITEPFLAPLRRILGHIRIGGGYIDISPLVFLILLDLLRRLISFR